MWDLAEVGSIAPALSLGEHDAPQRRPRLLAFLAEWSLDLAAVRARLAELDTELVIVCGGGAWCITRDREPQYCDRLAEDARTASAAYSVGHEAVFVIDPRGVIQFAHRQERALGAALMEALDAAAEALHWREHHTKLERVQWSAREWALKSLVVGCSLTFAGQPVPKRSRFARGTGPVRACVSRVSITPSAPTGAPAPQILADAPPSAETSSRRAG